MFNKGGAVWYIAALVLLLMGLAGCGSGQAAAPKFTGAAGQPAPATLSPVALDEDDTLKVVATTSIVADIVRQVGGDNIDLSVLLPMGVDPHAFEPTPRDLARVAGAHVVFANGFGLEVFLDSMLSNAGGQAAIVYVSAGVTPRRLAVDRHQAGAGDAEHTRTGEVDPHTWTSPANALVFVDNIEQALIALDPAHADAYSANAQAYRRELRELDAWVKGQIEQIPPENRKLVTDHTAFGYYADRYGLTQVGAVIPAFSTTAEPSAGELATLEDTIRTYGVKAIFVSNTVNPALSERVARDTGIRLLTLYIGSLGGLGSGAETYLDYIRYNTRTIVEGLK